MQAYHQKLATVATGDWGSGQASGLIATAAGASGSLCGALKDVVIDPATDDAVDAEAGKVVAKPGSTTVPTPISVTKAVTACDGEDNAGSGYGVAWKYY